MSKVFAYFILYHFHLLLSPGKKKQNAMDEYLEYVWTISDVRESLEYSKFGKLAEIIADN